MFEIQEINPKTFNKDSYYTSTLNEGNNRRFKKSINNYYTEPSNSNLDQAIINEIAAVKYNKKFLNICEENSNNSRYISNYLTSAMKINKETFAAASDPSSSSNKQESSSKFDIPNNLKLLYKCTKPPEKLLPNKQIWENKSMNYQKVRLNSIKKVLNSKRNLIPYIENLDDVSYKWIYKKNVDKLRLVKHRRKAK
ncbi:hypothetical protein QEN19_002156 [Hanseniaspora menglaensis]